jgi:Na+-transporting methylmalonyl-CoA/oxaloacetate decarboxylase gamma subunit
METFIDQIWLTLLSAFVVFGFLAVMVCAIWLVKVIAERVLHARVPKNIHPYLSD